MTLVYDLSQQPELVILAAVSDRDENSTLAALGELEELARTAGAVVCGKVIQKLERPNLSTYLGKGKLEELAVLVQESGASGVICDDELTPAQMAGMAEVLDVKVMDRTLLILDIFAAHATTREGAIQVELAQLRYRATRLTGLGKSLSRLGGGIGTRGPGEKKLEIDRRRIRERISILKKDLEEIRQHRELSRSRRQKNSMPVISIVGYTNAGKSTLLNRLTGAGVLEEDMLFATLDPVTRNLVLENGQEVLLTDTVGFIHKLPHHLVEAFRSTLEEARYADLIIHMVDASHPQCDMHMQVVYDTLRSLDVGDKKIITVFNKIDLLEEQGIAFDVRDLRADATVRACMKDGRGIEQLLTVISDFLQESSLLIERVFKYEEAGSIAVIRKYGQLLEERYQEDGIYVRARIPRDIYARIAF